MKIFIDTANVAEIREAHAWGIIDGVTTNPSLIAKEGRDFIEVVHEICEIVHGPVSAEVVAQDTPTMIQEGRLLSQVHTCVVVKLPLTHAGLAACRALSAEGIHTNVTLCFQAGQALLAAKAGATYVSPFVGRLDDIGEDGMDLIKSIATIYRNDASLHTQILAASIRHPLHVVQAAEAGAHVATIPFKVLKALALHPLTDKGNAAFMKDWEGVPERDVSTLVRNWLARRQA